MKKFYESLDIKGTNRWLVTGVAGFIGSNIAEALLTLDQKVIGIDNFSTGLHSNIDFLSNLSGNNFEFYESDIKYAETLKEPLKDIKYVIHQAALGSVPRSIADPVNSVSSNITGFVNILNECKNSKIESFVYASSSAVYGDSITFPRKEGNEGNALSPYAITKTVNELYSKLYWKLHNFPSVGLRYFNVFGPRQNPEGPYAAVIPKWIGLMLDDKRITIYGDGTTSRDFCYIDNVILANIKASLLEKKDFYAFNIGQGIETSLNELFLILCDIYSEKFNQDYKYSNNPLFSDFRKGDVLRSNANISSAIKILKYLPTVKIKDDLKNTFDSIYDNLRN
jgi:UDP-N-acetylglucosamine 4-epimerase